MNADEIINIEDTLKELRSRTQEMNNELLKYARDLEWKYAVEKADSRYKTKYIDTLSETYRMGSDWWVEIGDSLKEYFKRKPHIEVWVRTLYFSNYK